MTKYIFFSPSTCGAYWPGINTTDTPADVVEFPLSDWESLLSELAKSPKKIATGSAGLPVLIDPPELDSGQLNVNERAWRDMQLTSTDAVVARHRDELESGGESTLTAGQYSELQLYRRYLRDWPQGDEFPLSQHRPQAPGWLLI